MKLSAVLSIAALTLAMVAQSGFAQADAKAKGNVYNFWQTMGWQQHAKGQARSLYYYGQTHQPTAAQAREHATAARQGVANAQKGLAELKKANPDHKEAQAAIAKIEEMHKKVLGHCEMIDKTLAQGDRAEMCACCADLYHDLDGLDAEMLKLQKALHIEKPELPKR